MAFEIVTRARVYTNDWRTDEIGDNNVFATEAEAREAIEALRGLGEEWASAEYDVRQIHHTQSEEVYRGN